MRSRRAAVTLPLAVLLLAGCGTDPADERREQVAAITEAANSGDADRVRDRAEGLVELVARQAERQELAADEAARLTELAQAVRAGADLIDDDLIERRRAEAEAEAERQRLEQERRQLEEDRKKAEEDRKKAEEERKQLEEDRQKAEEDAKKAEEERQKAEEEKGKDKKDEEDD